MWFGNVAGFGIPSLDSNACTEPVMKCTCEKCRVMRDKLLKFYDEVKRKQMNPRNKHPLAENSRSDHFERRKAEIKRLMAAGHTKKRAQQIAKDKGF